MERCSIREGYTVFWYGMQIFWWEKSSYLPLTWETYPWRGPSPPQPSRMWRLNAGPPARKRSKRAVRRTTIEQNRSRPNGESTNRNNNNNNNNSQTANHSAKRLTNLKKIAPFSGLHMALTRSVIGERKSICLPAPYFTSFSRIPLIRDNCQLLLRDVNKGNSSDFTHRISATWPARGDWLRLSAG